MRTRDKVIRRVLAAARSTTGGGWRPTTTLGRRAHRYAWLRADARMRAEIDAEAGRISISRVDLPHGWRTVCTGDVDSWTQTLAVLAAYRIVDCQWTPAWFAGRRTARQEARRAVH
jgi:hypothetical protein